MSLQSNLQQAIRSALGCANDFNGDLHAMCDVYGIPMVPISGRLIPAAQKFDASITDASSALNYFLMNPQNACGTLALDFTKTSTLDPRITFSRGSQATLFDSTGTLVYAKHNLVLQSEDFATTWTVTGATVSTNAATAPNGTATADKLAEDSSTGSHLVSQNITYGVGTYTASLFAKKAERDWVRVLFFDGTNTFSAFFNLNTGVVGTVTGTGASAAIQSVGDGWYRCLVTATTAAGAGSFAPRVALADNNSSYTGSTGSGIFIWGAQLNLAGMEGGVTFSLATYYPTTTAAYYAPRFDYNPSTLAAQGLLIEEQRTNSIRNNTMQGAVAGTPGTAPTNWLVDTTGGVFTRTISGPSTESGITYIDIQVQASAGGTFVIRPEPGTQVAASVGQVWANTAYVKLAAGSLTNAACSIRIRENDSGGSILSEGTVNFTPTSAGLATQRVSITRTLASATVAFIQPRIEIIFSGAGDLTLRIGLPQLEQGAFATSVIPTTTTALTRNADVASMTGTNFSSWYNQTEGTLYYEGMVQVNNDGIVYTGIGDTFDNTAYFVRAAPNQTWAVRSGASAQATIDVVFTPTANVPFKMVGTLKVNDFAFCVNGGTVATDVSGAVPAGAVRLGIGNSPWAASGGNARQQWIRSIRYYPVRLPNSTLQALTA